MFRVTVLRTRLELVSIHHLLLLVEWFSVPALVAITVDSVVLLLATVDSCRRPGPSLRFTCRAGIWSPGRTVDMIVSFELPALRTQPSRVLLIWHCPLQQIFLNSLIFRQSVKSFFAGRAYFSTRREDLEDLISDPVFFQAIFHSLECVKDLYRSQAELGMANEAIASECITIQLI